MTEQVQCPNCGGFKVTNKLLKYLGPRVGSGGIIELVLGVASLILTGATIVGMGGGNAPLAIGSIIAALVCGFIALKRSSNRMKHSIAQIPANEIRWDMHSTCDLCGNVWDWTWVKGHALPRYTVRSDLIYRGEARLRQRAEEDAHARHVAEDVLWRRPWEQK